MIKLPARPFIVSILTCVISDRAALNEIVARTEKQGGGIRTLLHEVVRSPLFQTR